MQRCIFRGVCVLALVATCATPAAGQDDAIASFAFSDLLGNFDSGAMLFEAADDYDSDGDVTRLVATEGDAFFQGTPANGGFSGDAAFELSMPIADNGGQMVTQGGTIKITDVDGDYFMGTVEGEWTSTTVVTSAAFGGSITNVQVVQVGDGMFIGDTGTGFSLDFSPATPPFEGSLITLAFGRWFADQGGTFQDFSDANTSVGGAIVPEPITLSLLLVGGLAAARRRR